MRTKVFAAVVVSILGISTAVGAQSRGRPPAGARTNAGASAAGAGRAPLGRTASRQTMPLRPGIRPPGPHDGRFGPPPAAYQRVMDRSAAAILRGRHGAISAPRGATLRSVTTMYRDAWRKMNMGGDGVSMVTARNNGAEFNTYFVDMGRPTGQVTYPPNARGGLQRGIPRQFTHIVIQVRTGATGRTTMRIFEPGGGPPPDATPVPVRAYARTGAAE